MILWKDMGLKNEGEVLQANRNGFFITTRAGTIPNVSIGETDDATDGTVLNAHADDLQSLNPKDATNGKPNTDYLRNANSKYTIKDGKYRGFPIFDSKQKID